MGIQCSHTFHIFILKSDVMTSISMSISILWLKKKKKVFVRETESCDVCDQDDAVEPGDLHVMTPEWLTLWKERVRHVSCEGYTPTPNVLIILLCMSSWGWIKDSNDTYNYHTTKKFFLKIFNIKTWRSPSWWAIRLSGFQGSYTSKHDIEFVWWIFLVMFKK